MTVELGFVQFQNGVKERPHVRRFFGFTARTRFIAACAIFETRITSACAVRDNPVYHAADKHGKSNACSCNRPCLAASVGLCFYE